MRSSKDRFRPFLRLEPARAVPLMIQGVHHAWKLHLARPAEPVWFERFLTPQFRSSFRGIAGCEAYAGLSARDVPKASRSRAWSLLLEHIAEYPRFELARKVTLLRALGALSLYRDVEELTAGGEAFGAGAWTRTQCEYRLIVERVRFLLHEPKLTAKQSLVFLDIAERAPAESTVRLESAIFFLSRALEKGLAQPEIDRGRKLASAALARLRGELPAWEHARWRSKYWRCVSYEAYLRGDPRKSRRELTRAEKAARECVRDTPKGKPEFGLEDLYGVLTTKALTEAKLGSPRRSRGILEELIALDPEGAWQRLELARLLMAEEKWREAEVELTACVRFAPPRESEACLWLETCCARTGRPDEARAWKRRAEEAKLSERALSASPATRSTGP